MYLQFLTTTAYILASIFIIVLIYTFRKKSFSEMWEMAKKSVKQKLKIKTHQEKAIAAGKRPFYFENGKIVVYAKTQARAIFDYKQLKLQERYERIKKANANKKITIKT